jgi:hypothetical protein
MYVLLGIFHEKSKYLRNELRDKVTRKSVHNRKERQCLV